MLSEFLTLLQNWHPWDTSMMIAGGLAAMSCAVPGVWLVLRRQSMMGDALAHTALPGVVMAILFANWMATSFDAFPRYSTAEPFLLMAGAVLIGILTAVLTEWIQHLGKVESSAALGVVFTSLFALGLLLIRLKADNVHLDPDCVLFGQLELIVWDEVQLWGFKVPRAYLINGGSLLINLTLLAIFYKELRISAFDPEMATAQGIPSRMVNYCLMAATAMTVVMAFESVGSILVIGLLIVPAATSLLLTDRLGTTIGLSLLVAGASAVLGQVLAKTIPVIVFRRLGFDQVSDAGTSGMIAVASGLIFVMTFILAPRYGLVGKLLSRLKLRLQIAADDILATLYRFEEQLGTKYISARQTEQETQWIVPAERWLAMFRLQRSGLLLASSQQLELTDQGRTRAAELVGSHRLWESYMHKHFDLPDDHLHEMAHYVEHFLDEEMRSQLKDELDSPDRDPHGRKIPDHSDAEDQDLSS